MEKEPVKVFQCTLQDMHPWECDGSFKCIHCDGEKTENHDPETCALCNDH